MGMLTLGDPGYELWRQFEDGRVGGSDHPVVPRWARVRGLRAAADDLFRCKVDVDWTAAERRTRTATLFAQGQDLLRMGAEEFRRRGCALVFTDAEGILLASFGVDA